MLSLGTIGLQSRDIISCAFDNSDLIITTGYDFVEHAPYYWNENGKTRPILHIDSAPSEIDEFYHTTLELTGNIAATLKLLVEEAQKEHLDVSKDSRYCTELRSMINDELTKYAQDDSFPIKPQRVICELRAALSDGDILVSDVGMHKVWISRLFPAYSPNTVIVSNGFSTMGISLPGAIAAKLAKPDNRVVAVCGDGGMKMCFYDLETARDLKLSFVVLIFDDGQYSQVDWKQRSKFGESYFVKFRNPDFVKLAESFGCKGVRVSSARALKETLSTALKSDGVWVLDVPVDTNENLLLSERLGGKAPCPDQD